jgi:hypothetical protein
MDLPAVRSNWQGHRTKFLSDDLALGAVVVAGVSASSGNESPSSTQSLDLTRVVIWGSNISGFHLVGVFSVLFGFLFSHRLSIFKGLARSNPEFHTFSVHCL